MPVLKEIKVDAEVVWLGCVREEGETLRSEPLSAAYLHFEGIDGEAHSGLTRPSCVRVKNLYEPGTTIRNTRQLSVLSEEELGKIAEKMGVETLAPTFLGAALVIRGISDFSHVPPSSRLVFPSGASICIDLENRPCIYPGREIDKDLPGLGPKFKPAAEGRRGIVGWVEREGDISIGDKIRLFIPDQPAWHPVQQASG